ncbi:MAG: deoxyhypusine synthase family protein [Candidatus Aenigmarchaeota archaeon]|nr:deoxyhypusine synthase family protein [Candidatus Aenigmarchaeota archaeon]
MNEKIELKEKVKSIEINGPKSISQLLSEMANTGFQGKKLGQVADVWEKMVRDKDATIILGYAGSLSTTGQWKIINWLIENRFIDVLVSTGANISEDIVEAMGFDYWQGSQYVDDNVLLNQNVNRYYDVFGKESDYMKMTELIADFYTSSLKGGHPYSSRELLYMFGKWLEEKGVNSIVATAAKHNVPIFCPAIVDSPYGDAGLIAKSKGFNLVIDNMKDYTEFMSLGEKIKETAVVYIGGGVPKDFIQLLAVTPNLLYQKREIPGRKSHTFRVKESKQEVRETYYPHKYAIQITTDSPQWGGLSGCTFEEAISWGKINHAGNFVQCYADVTIALPIVIHALNERVKSKRGGLDLMSHLEK